jgi:hypothetical protein
LSEDGKGYYILDDEKYYYCVTNNSNILKVYTGQSGVLLLYVEKGGDGNLVRWCYSEPLSAEQTTQQTTQQTTD